MPIKFQPNFPFDTANSNLYDNKEIFASSIWKLLLHTYTLQSPPSLPWGWGRGLDGANGCI